MNKGEWNVTQILLSFSFFQDQCRRERRKSSGCTFQTHTHTQSRVGENWSGHTLGIAIAFCCEWRKSQKINEPISNQRGQGGFWAGENQKSFTKTGLSLISYNCKEVARIVLLGGVWQKWERLVWSRWWKRVKEAWHGEGEKRKEKDFQNLQYWKIQANGLSFFLSFFLSSYSLFSLQKRGWRWALQSK